MIKKFLVMMLCALITVGVVTSCGENAPVDDNTEQEQPEDPTPEGPEDPDNPTPENPTPEDPTPEDPTPDTPVQTPVDIYPGVPTPIVAYQDKVIATKEGVSVEVTKIENRNFVFNLRPGESVQSYRLDVYPLAHLYNSLYERMLSEGKSSLDARSVDTYIRDLLFNSTGSGGFTFDPVTHSDYADKEFDWMSTSYAQARVVPDAEYIIIAIACYDKEGTEDGEMSLCYVKTTSSPLIGDPHVNVNVAVNYTAMDITYEPNSHCKYLYQWCSNESDLMPYINTYGEKLYIDFMRHSVIGDPISASDPDACHFYIDFGQSASADVPIMATAIALDENYTPAATMDYKVFQLLEKPVVEPAEVNIKVVEGRVGASYAWLELKTEANAPYMFYKFLTPEQAEHYKTKATEDELKAFALTLNNDGYGLKNANYSYDDTTKQYGQSFTTQEVYYLTPNTEYVVAYVGRNRVQELGEVKFTEVFKTKALTTDSPSACQSDCVINLVAAGRTAVTFNVEYSLEKHAGVRFQYIEPVLEGSTQPSADASRETFLSFLGFGMAADAQGQYANNWAAEFAGKDSFTLAGFDPGVKIKCAYMSEDWNGVVGELKFAEVTLPSIAEGDDVVSNVSGNYNPLTGTVTFTFTANDQTARMLYLVGDVNLENDALKIKYLGNEDFYTAEEMIKRWRTYCSAQGLSTNNIHTTIEEPAGKTMVALCIPYSQSGVRGELAYAIWDGTELKFKTLSDYYPNYKPSSATTSSSHPALQSIKVREQKVVTLK